MDHRCLLRLRRVGQVTARSINLTALFWRTQTTEDALRRQAQTNYHSPARYRVNGVVRNLDAWYAAFDVGPDAALYLPPEERVTVW